MKFLRVAYISLLLNIFFYSNAYAYIDPGTGSIILATIISFIASIGVFAKGYYRKFISFFKNFLNKSNNKNK